MKKNLKKTLFALLAAFLFSLPVFAQDITVKGQVKEAKTGEAIIGASIIVKGASTGTISDIDGNFTLKAPSQSTVVVSYIGFKSKEFKATTNAGVIALEEDAVMLGEIVAIGYGSQKRKEVTGAVSTVKPENFRAGVQNSPAGLLQGKVAGLNISRTAGGDPTNTGYNIQIRGFSTLDKGTGSTPLFIVDGIPVNNIDNIAPDDIASLDVLKDGSAAAIYGTRGTNGVIIITTKRGMDTNAVECGTSAVEYSSYVSISTRTGSAGMATPEEFRNLENISGGKIIPTIYKDAAGNDNYHTDWVKELTRTAITHNHNVAISGATKNFGYRGSLTYKNSEGIAINSGREEIIGKLAANQKALDGWLDLQYDFSYMHYRNDFFTGDFKQASIVNPTYPIYDPSTPSGFFKPQGTGQSNPVEGAYQRESYQDGNFFRGSVRPTINIKPVSGLRLSAFVALEKGDNYRYWNNKIINDDPLGSGKAGRNTDRSINNLYEATVDYVTSFNNHNISSVFGYSYQEFMYDGSNMSNGGFITEGNKYYQMGNGDISKKPMDIGSYRNLNELAAFFGRVNYNYEEKYLLSASLRREGSTRFGANRKWGYFPAVSTGWRISGEDFMQSVKWVNDLKVRLGFGVTGNNLTTNFMSLPLYEQGGTFWYNGAWVRTYTIKRDPNKELRWEKKLEYNLGVDFSLINNRLYGSIDAYLRDSKDLLWTYRVQVPPYEFDRFLANAGEMRSKGLEITLNGVPVKTKDLTWTTTPTIAFNRSKIIKLSEPSQGFNYDLTLSGVVGELGLMNTDTQILIEGQAPGNFYGYKFAYIDDTYGWIFSTPEGGYTPNPTDPQRQVVGRNAQPLFIFGWNNTFTYKNFDLSFFFRGVYGNDVLNITRWAYGPDKSQSLNVFMKDARKGVYANKTYFSDYYLEDGSYVKLDNVTLGYTFPVKENKIVRSLRLYATGQNLLTLTAYSGKDPEVNTTDIWNAGIDYPNFYPNVTNVMVGVNINFY